MRELAQSSPAPRVLFALLHYCTLSRTVSLCKNGAVWKLFPSQSSHADELQVPSSLAMRPALSSTRVTRVTSS